MSKIKEKNAEVRSGDSEFSLSDFNSQTYLAHKVIPDTDDSYNPFEHRVMNKPNSVTGALIHILKSSLGSGVLAMPMAFKNSGWLFGVIGTVIVGFLCTHCVHILIKTSHNICRKTKTPVLSFASTCSKVFEYGPPGVQKYAYASHIFVEIALLVTFLGGGSVYIVFIATSFHNVINDRTNLTWDTRIYIVLVLIPVFCLGQIRQLKNLVPFSAVANIFIVITFGITLYYMFNDTLDYDKPLITSSVTSLPLFFSTAIFAMEGIGVVFPVENSMKKPQYFLGCPGVLNIAMSIVVSLYALMGFFGYVRFGDDVQGSITLNLPTGEGLADAARILMALALFCTCGLLFYVPMEILWVKVEHKIPVQKHNLVQFLMRGAIITSVGVVSVAIPQLDPFISLVGAVCYSILGFFIPAVVETVYLYPDELGKCRWILWKNLFLVLLSIFALLSGSYASIKQIIAIYTN